MSCIRCQGASGHPPIVGDGPLVCTPCVYKYGRLAADPTGARALVRDVFELAIEHEDTVSFDWTEMRWVRNEDSALLRRLRDMFGEPA